MTDRELIELEAKAFNQCQGCQAGWPIETRRSAGKSMLVHLVKGGYSGEVSSCEADKYRAAAEIGKAM